MGKIAFVFSGQGAQHPGMGQKFYETNASVRELFDRAEAIRPGTLDQCFRGTEEVLRQTENTQPCLYLTDLAAALALRDTGITPDCAAGFSLGELPALAWAGGLSHLDGFSLVCKRGQLMAGSTAAASMAAVVKLSNETVENLCGEFPHVYPVNYNSPGQLVVAGADQELPEFIQKVRAAGGRALPLKVSGAFHSPYMAGAAESFREVLETVEYRPLAIPVYANPTAASYGGDIPAVLGQQMDRPVRWVDTIWNMAAVGVDTFIECGVGSTLKKFIEKIVPECRAFAVEDPESLAAVKEALGC